MGEVNRNRLRDIIRTFLDENCNVFYVDEDDEKKATDLLCELFREILEEEHESM
jgi:hypothetical protein